jgi:hypothetical protein
VTYVIGAPERVVRPNDDAVGILLPGDNASYRAVFRLLSGRQTAARVSAPSVSIVPPGWLDSIRGVQPSELLVLAFDCAFYREKVCTALGFDAPKIATPCTVVDRFIRELGNAIRSEFHSSRLPGSAYHP